MSALCSRPADGIRWVLLVARAAVRSVVGSDFREQLWLVWFDGDWVSQKTCLFVGAGTVGQWLRAAVPHLEAAMSDRYAVVLYSPLRCPEAAIAASLLTGELAKLSSERCGCLGMVTIP